MLSTSSDKLHCYWPHALTKSNLLLKVKQSTQMQYKVGIFIVNETLMVFGKGGRQYALAIYQIPWDSLHTKVLTEYIGTAGAGNTYIKSCKWIPRILRVASEYHV